MQGRFAIPLILAGTVLAAAMPAIASAQDGPAAADRRVFTEKPRIEDYDDYGTFLVDIMAFRRQKEDQARELAARATERTLGAAEGSPAVAEELPLSPLARDPYRVRKPESLEEALERARYIKHTDHNELVRFQRTTSQSFPLEALETTEMSTAELPGMLADPATGQLAIHEDDTTEKQAKKSESTSAEDEDALDTRATADSFAISQAEVESAGGSWVRDADGQRFYLQIGDRTNQYSFSYGSGDYVINYLYVDLAVEHKE